MDKKDLSIGDHVSFVHEGFHKAFFGTILSIDEKSLMTPNQLAIQITKSHDLTYPAGKIVKVYPHAVIYITRGEEANEN